MKYPEELRNAIPAFFILILFTPTLWANDPVKNNIKNREQPVISADENISASAVNVPGIKESAMHNIETDWSQSDIRAINNSPKPPLFKSRREQYLSRDWWEVGIAISTTHVVSDVGLSKGLPLREFFQYHSANNSFGGGIYGRYIFNEWFSAGASATMLRLSGERDFYSELRGSEIFSFTNTISEFAVQAEYRLPVLAASPFDLYGFMGLGIFLNDIGIYDKFGRPEALTADFSQIQPFLLLGGSFSVKLTNKFKVNYEFGWRNTIFHYLDGVKLADSFDHYFLNTLKIGYIL
jgi:hypothetical protein